jgi:hypothetical protein
MLRSILKDASLTIDVLIDVKNDQDKEPPPREVKNGIEANLKEAVHALKMQATGCYTTLNSVIADKSIKTMLYENEGFLRGMATRLEGLLSVLEEFNVVHVDAMAMPVDVEDYLSDASESVCSAMHDLGVIMKLSPANVGSALQSVYNLLNVAVSEINDAIQGVQPE